MRLRWTSLTLLLIGLSLLGNLARAEPTPESKVLLISIDGFRAIHLKTVGPWKEHAPTLHAITPHGIHVQQVTPPFPAMTYVGHATMVTGVSPAAHGITGNTRFHPTRWASGFCWADAIKAPTIWDRLKAEGRSCAAAFWPTTVGADMPFLIPEMFGVKNLPGRIRKESTEGVIESIEEKTGIAFDKALSNVELRDQFATAAAIQALEGDHELVLLHLLELDKKSHKYGPESDEAQAALGRIDHHIRTIIEQTAERGIDLQLVVIGDHGFTDISEMIGPNAELVDQQWYDLDDGTWLYRFRTEGMVATLYRNPEASGGPDVATVQKHFASLAGKEDPLYQVVDRKKLEELGTFPDASFSLASNTGFSFSSSKKNFRFASRSLKGNHGGPPGHPTMNTTCLIVGSRFSAKMISSGDMRSLAPTLAQILDLDADPAFPSPGFDLTEALRAEPGPTLSERIPDVGGDGQPVPDTAD